MPERKQMVVNGFDVELVIGESLVDARPQVSAAITSDDPWFHARSDTTWGAPQTNRALGVPENTAHLARCCVSPAWEHEPATATLHTVFCTLDHLGFGLVVEAKPYHNATAEDRARYIAWLQKQGFMAIEHDLMFRPATSTLTAVHSSANPA